MSYDLAVLDPAVVPDRPEAFPAWWDEQTEWKAPGWDYNDPAKLSAPLRRWFDEMIAVYPPMNGPLAPESADNSVDYCLGPGLIYAAFAYSMAAEAFPLARDAALRHGAVFFAVGDNGDLEYPDGTVRDPYYGLLSTSPVRREPWWQRFFNAIIHRRK